MDSILNYTVNDILEILGEKPQLEGLHVYFQRKAITEIPFSFPYRSNNYTIHFVVKGRISLALNLIDYNLEKHDIIVIPPKTVIAFNSVELESELATISFSLDFAFAHSAKHIISVFDFFSSQLIKKLSVNEEQWESFMSITLFLEKKNNINSEILFRKEIISHTFNLFLYELAITNVNNQKPLKNILSRKDELSLRFLKLLELHFKSQKNIEYYAHELSVSSSYLTKAIKSATGKTAGKLIENSLITEAQILLTGTTLSVSQIADELQFSNPSFFGKFFKKRIGFNPTEYRNQHLRLNKKQ